VLQDSLINSYLLQDSFSNNHKQLLQDNNLINLCSLEDKMQMTNYLRTVPKTYCMTNYSVTCTRLNPFCLLPTNADTKYQ